MFGVLHIHQVTGLTHELESNPEQGVIPAYNVHRLVIRTADGQEFKLALFCDPKTTPAWPQEEKV